MDASERIDVEVDEFGVPYGEESCLLSSFLGTIAKNNTLTPLSIENWKRKEFKPFKRQILSLTKSKFRYPVCLERWILQLVDKKWVDFKYDLKSKHFDVGKTVESIMEEGLPEGVTDANQWYTLVASWFSKENKKRSAVNRANAKKKNVFHTGGRRSIARTRKRLKEKLGRTPTRLEVFEANHKRKDGTYINDHAKEFMDKANEMEGPSEEVFQKLAGPEHPGRLRCIWGCQYCPIFGFSSFLMP
ncbi:unnamed protein product [Linum trigynum]|uniref:Transposase n=1 Tax=Linum trigynum TaxID=586398 RepID=A0AAV2FPI6_9ROSI